MLGRRICQLVCLSSVLWLGVAPTKISANATFFDVKTKPYLKGWNPSPCYFMGAPREVKPMRLICKNLTSEEQLADVFRKLKEPLHLHQLILDNLQFKSLPSGVFGKATFKSLTLQKTEIETIDPDAFQGMEDSDTSLYFLDNKIKRFDFMARMKKLGFVIMSNNSIEQISDRAFANISSNNNTRVSFMNNPINSIGDYAFANYSGFINFKYNTVPLTKIGDSAFYCCSKNCSTHISFINVKIVDTALSPKTFVGSDIRAIQFSNTSLSTLQKEVFFPLVQNIRECKGRIITVKGNPVKCDQSIKWIVANITLKKMFDFECENEKNVADLTEEDLTV